MLTGAVCHVHVLVREIYDHEEEAPMSTDFRVKMGFSTTPM